MKRKSKKNSITHKSFMWSWTKCQSCKKEFILEKMWVYKLPFQKDSRGAKRRYVCTGCASTEPLAELFIEAQNELVLKMNRLKAENVPPPPPIKGFRSYSGSNSTDMS